MAAYGYMGKLLRVDLTEGTMREETIDDETFHYHIGGVGLGLKYLYEETSPTIDWSDPANRLVFTTGPLSGTRAPSSGTFCVVTKGAQTNQTTSAQANGFFGAFMKFAGYDAFIIQGASPDWVYLHIDENGPELRDARFLLGKGAIETEQVVIDANPKRNYTVYGIGPAGENLVNFAMIAGDKTHIAAHNGVGAVMGSKKLKCIALARCKQPVTVANPEALVNMRKVLLERVQNDPLASINYRLGTPGYFSMLVNSGMLPVKNYTTSLFPEHEQCNGAYLRTNFEPKKTACWACHTACTRSLTVTTGPYAGFKGEEPEYEGMAACAPLIGNSDAGSMVWLANYIDDLGIDINEAGWVMGFAIECYERGILTKEDTGGIELTWGNVPACGELLKKIAHQEGIGKLFQRGTKGAAETLGGEALEIGIYTKKGVSPRTHDHRANISEILEYCVTNTGTLEFHLGVSNAAAFCGAMGIPLLADKFNYEMSADYFAAVNGWRNWFDSMGICQTSYPNAQDIQDTYEAVTGVKRTVREGWFIGRRMVHQMRIYNIGAGCNAAMEEPSIRYSSVVRDGPAKGRNIREHWDEYKARYYKNMGWDEVTGFPTIETLKEYGLEHLIPDLEKYIAVAAK